MADIREQLLAAFELEQREHLDVLRLALARARAGDPPDWREPFRRAHSLKGAARAVDAGAIENEAHALEAAFAQALEGAQLDERALDEATGRLDAIERITQLMFQKAEAFGESSPSFMRIDADLVSGLTAAMHELSSDLSTIEASAVRLRALKAQAEALARFSEAASAGQLGPSDLAAIATESRSLARALAAETRQQSETSWAAGQAAARLRGQIERVSIAPASSVFSGLDLMVRELAQEAGREVNFHASGLDVQADRQLLQRLRDPVIQLLRNAIAHGIEAADDRVRRRKPARGDISLEIRSRGDRLVVTVADDGAGPDLAAIERTATARRLIAARGPGEPLLAPEFLLTLIFEPGFSTVAAADKIAGRGMGLSIVAEEVRAAGGDVHMRRRFPWGSEVVISTPLSASRQAVVLVRERGEVFALPAHAVERIIRAPAGEVDVLDGRRVVRMAVDGNSIVLPFVPALSAVGLPAAAADEAEVVHIAVLRQGEQRLGLSAEAFEDVRMATVSALEGDEPVLGAIDLGGGAAAVVLDVANLIQRYSRNELDLGPRPVAPAAQTRRKTILVVDDSITTRTLEKSILEAHGYHVVVTVDGVDALSALHSATTPIDLIVADVEMPRMDGFQLLQALKNDAQLSTIPVIMMTSRADPTDVRRGLELGADAYLVKQLFDQRELVTTIGQLL